MMPGIQIYRALGGAMQLGRAGCSRLTDIGMTAGFAIEACLVVAALALGLVIGARVVPMFPHTTVHPNRSVNDVRKVENEIIHRN